MFYGLLALLITSANILNIVVFCGKKLRRKRTNFLLINLAVVDLLVGILALPLLIYTKTLTSSEKVQFVSRHADMITSFTSLFSLAVISLERMYAVCWPFRHRTLSSRAYILAVCTPWILVIAGIILVELVADIFAEQHLANILISCSLILPLIIICISYFVIWKKQRNSSQQNLSQHRSALQDAQERKLAKTLLIIIGTFVVTWLPFEVINTYNIACRYRDDNASCKLPPVIMHITVFLRFSNSFVNFIVYSLRIPEFKEQLRKMCHLCRKSCTRQEDVLPAAPVPLAEETESASVAIAGRRTIQLAKNSKASAKNDQV